MEKTYTIMKGQVGLIECNDMQTAIRFVQTLESGMDRFNSHSPYTIMPTDQVKPVAASVQALNRALISNLSTVA